MLLSSSLVIGLQSWSRDSCRLLLHCVIASSSMTSFSLGSGSGSWSWLGLILRLNLGFRYDTAGIIISRCSYTVTATGSLSKNFPKQKKSLPVIRTSPQAKVLCKSMYGKKFIAQLLRPKQSRVHVRRPNRRDVSLVCYSVSVSVGSRSDDCR